MPQPILDAVPLGCFNLHASLLPRWRGAAPINRAIMAGDTETGAMTMKMDAGLDTGDIAMIDRVAITDAMTAGDLHGICSAVRGGGVSWRRPWTRLPGVLLRLTPQPSGRRDLCRQDRQERGENRLDKACACRAEVTATDCRRFQARGSNLWSRARSPASRSSSCELAQGSALPGQLLDDRLTIACGDGAIRIMQLQRAGKQAMTATDFLRGTPVAAGLRAM